MTKRKRDDTTPTASRKLAKVYIDLSLFDTIVYIEVGPTKQKFGMHKALLCNTSPYFKAALTGKFEEAETGVIVMDDESPGDFTHFNSWLYTGRIFQKDHDSSKTLEDLSALYFFANKKIITALQDDIIGVLLRIRLNDACIPSCVFPSSIWPSLSECPKLYDLLVDWFVGRARQPLFLLENITEQYDVRCITAIANSLARRLREGRPLVERALWRRCCRWQVHDIALPCIDGFSDIDLDSEPGLSETREMLLDSDLDWDILDEQALHWDNSDSES